MKKRQNGVTLMELMIVVVIISILAAVAYPSYQDHVTRSRRSDGKSALMASSQAMERFYTENNTYVGATLGTTGIYPATSSEGFYSLALSNQAANTFTITATPAGSHTDTACGNFTYTQAGVRGVSGSAGVELCWNR